MPEDPCPESHTWSVHLELDDAEQELSMERLSPPEAEYAESLSGLSVLPLAEVVDANWGLALLGRLAGLLRMPLVLGWGKPEGGCSFSGEADGDFTISASNCKEMKNVFAIENDGRKFCYDTFPFSSRETLKSLFWRTKKRLERNL